ncbi:MAG: hypothetical protein K1X55_17300 [Chitinophagales bacterium]|nr:hypothetical protein [Chitinophagales bacterium]
MKYHYLNLPQTITFTNGNTITITYDARGRKMKKTVTQSGNTTTKEYRSSFEFAGSNLEAYYHEEGIDTTKSRRSFGK